MKKKSVYRFAGLFLLLYVVSFFCACTSGKAAGVILPEETISSGGMRGTDRQITNHSFLDKTHLGTELVIYGLLESGANGVLTVTENPESRGRVTFKLAGAAEFLAEAQKLDSRFVEVRGILESVSGPWKKTLKTESVRTVD